MLFKIVNLSIYVKDFVNTCHWFLYWMLKTNLATNLSPHPCLCGITNESVCIWTNIYSSPVHWTLVGQLVREIMKLIQKNWIDDWSHGSAASKVILHKCFALKRKQQRIYWRSCWRRKSFWTTVQLINDVQYKTHRKMLIFRSILGKII